MKKPAQKPITKTEDIILFLESMGVQIKGEDIYRVVIVAEIRDILRVTVEKFVRGDTGLMQKVCEDYELIKKEKLCH